MALSAATETQVRSGLHEHNTVHALPPSPQSEEDVNRCSQNRDHESRLIKQNHATPFQKVEFTVDSGLAGSITPTEINIHQNVIENEAKLNGAAGTETPLSLNDLEDIIPLYELEPIIGTAAQAEQLTLNHEDPPKDTAIKQISVLPLLDVTPQIKAPHPEIPVENITAPVEVQIVENIAAPIEVQIEAPIAYDANAPAGTRLRHMIKNLDHILVCPGVYDGLSARIALEVGFEGLYMTGAGTNASRLGMADLGYAHLHDMRTNAEMIANLKPDGPPMIADMDTGYGGPMVIDRSVQQYHLAGVAGFHIEDQVMQKRCGHLQGKEVVDIDTYMSRIKACKAAAKRLRSDIVIIARTDALQSRGYDECIERLRRARDEGADMGLLEGFSSKAQARQTVKDLAPWPLCLNSVENGVSPLISVDEARDMGFRVIIFSFAALAPAYMATKITFERLKAHGVTGSDISPKTIFKCCGLEDSMVIDEQAGGNSFKHGV